MDLLGWRAPSIKFNHFGDDNGRWPLFSKALAQGPSIICLTHEPKWNRKGSEKIAADRRMWFSLCDLLFKWSVNCRIRWMDCTVFPFEISLSLSLLDNWPFILYKLGQSFVVNHNLWFLWWFRNLRKKQIRLESAHFYLLRFYLLAERTCANQKISRVLGTFWIRLIDPLICSL